MKLFDSLFGSQKQKPLSHTPSDQKRGVRSPTFVKTSTSAQNTNLFDAAEVLTNEQKATLQKKGNALLTAGDTDMALKIFSALKNYDGLMRVSKAYYKKGDIMQAYTAAHKAGAHREAHHLAGAIAGALRAWITPPNHTKTAHKASSAPADYTPPSKQNRAAILQLYNARKH